MGIGRPSPRATLGQAGRAGRIADESLAHGLLFNTSPPSVDWRSASWSPRPAGRPTAAAAPGEAALAWACPFRSIRRRIGWPVITAWSITTGRADPVAGIFPTTVILGHAVLSRWRRLRTRGADVGQFRHHNAAG